MFNIMPDLSAKVDGDGIEYKYQSSLVKTYLDFEATSKWAKFKSNSISTLSIIKDSLIKQGTLKSKHLNIKRDIQPGSLHSVLAVIGKYFQESNTIKNEYEMLAALREIKDSPGGFDALSENNKNIMYREDDIKNRFEAQPKNLMVLGKVLVSLCEDYANMQGNTNRSGKSTIVELIAKRNFDKELIYQSIVNDGSHYQYNTVRD